VKLKYLEESDLITEMETPPELPKPLSSPTESSMNFLKKWGHKLSDNDTKIGMGISTFAAQVNGFATGQSFAAGKYDEALLQGLATGASIGLTVLFARLDSNNK
jgi:hypothetical protein